MQDFYRMDGKVALVIGGSTGIGAKTAQLLAHRGAKVVVAGLGQSDIDKTVSEIEAEGGTALGVLVDLADESAVADCVQRTVDTFGALHALHANAAATGKEALANDVVLADMDFAAWDYVMTINLRGLALAAKYSIPPMIKAGGGSIVFSGSGRGRQGHLEYTAYGVSKSGVEGLSRYVATQYGKDGIRSNVLEIGLIMTDAVRGNVPEQLRDLFLQHHLTREFGRPEDVASAAAFLLSDEARFITGVTLPVDGGMGSHASVYADQRRMMSDLATMGA
ncbi:SDR family oxidoreductase [Sphingomonas populi]|uniref:SDR family oxidoreductase n=1 Tax=Sphingomonas populi TaxID=2484750 RepID=A0A4Q6Y2A2_9SPHN|nr:SDR family NAD(P)-dependent oxidoreductase [Sphingomonas populi]RZF63449.1 SDR family oxidoreductase [Sphingomonas populi]